MTALMPHSATWKQCALVAMAWCASHATRTVLYASCRHLTILTDKFLSNGVDTPVSGSYEYIIVGSGAGGAPLASRLALAGHSVLLVEAGDNKTDTYEYNVPALHAVASEFPQTAWNYYVRHYDDDVQQRRDSKLVYTLPNGTQYWGLDPPAGAAIEGVLYPRAGTLGGCTAHNAMVTIYPNRLDWENLQQITSDSSWSPDNMRTYFERLERSRYLPNSITGHGFNGWLETAVTQLTLIVQDLKVISLVLAAATAMGQTVLGGIITTVTGLGEVLLRDINNDSPVRDSSEGLYQVPLAMKVPEYKRAGPVDFMTSVLAAKNNDGSSSYKLDLALNTLVTKITLDSSTGAPRAAGVEFLAGQSLYRADPRSSQDEDGASGRAGSVTATREVIISAGAFNTPQILKLSGIGPRSELEQFGIDVKVDLPGVGKNLQDHHEVAVSGAAPSEISLIRDCTFLETLPDPCLVQWQNPNPLSKGVYATNGVALAILKKSAVAQNDTTDLFIAGWPANFHGYEPHYFETAIEGKNHWSWVTLRAHTPNNNGSVTLRSADPRDVPDIRFRLFSKGGDEDLAAMIEGTKYSREAFQSLIPLDGAFTEVLPGAQVQTDDEWKTYIQDETWGHHACCTAKIGRDDDVDAVLDGAFKVRGVDGLRVVDASVFPWVPGYFPVLSIYMIAEKAADVILRDAR